MFRRLRQFADKMKTCVLALYVAARDPRTPLLTKCLIVIVVSYALSPIDLIPDFIPVIGLLDDLLILPLGIYWVIKLLPDGLWRTFVVKAKNSALPLPVNYYAAVVVISLWLVGFVVLFISLSHHIQ